MNKSKNIRDFVLCSLLTLFLIGCGGNKNKTSTSNSQNASLNVEQIFSSFRSGQKISIKLVGNTPATNIAHLTFQVRSGNHLFSAIIGGALDDAFMPNQAQQNKIILTSTISAYDSSLQQIARSAKGIMNILLKNQMPIDISATLENQEGGKVTQVKMIHNHKNLTGVANQTYKLKTNPANSKSFIEETLKMTFAIFADADWL